MLNKVMKRASLAMRRTKRPSSSGGRVETGPAERDVRREMARVRIEKSSKNSKGVEECAVRGWETAWRVKAKIWGGGVSGDNSRAKRRAYESDEDEDTGREPDVVPEVLSL